jgi:hypothetical protein
MASFFEGEQSLTLLGVQLSGGEAKGKLKKLKMKLQLAMTSEVLGHAPDWAGEAYSYVAKHPDVISPPYEFEALDVEFSVDQLFGPKTAKAHAVSVKSFQIFKDGEAEDSDIVLTFNAEVAFADVLWRWVGAQQGKDFYARFTQVVEAEKPAAEAPTQMNLTVN